MNNNTSSDYFSVILEKASQTGASDIHLAAEQRPYLRINGKLSPLDLPAPDNTQLKNIIHNILEEKNSSSLPDYRHYTSAYQPAEKEPALQPLELKHSDGNELDFAWTYNDQRYRFNTSLQQGNIAIAVRIIPKTIPTLSELGCPPVFEKLLQKDSGLILVTGRTGSGKTTTLASFLAAAAKKQARHIITLEDPIEYLLPTDTSFISQREYGTDFQSFPAALKSALRQMPDILLTGELRDSETIRTALDAASTGHLVLASLHTKNAEETFMRIESFFPYEHQQIRTQLSIVFQAAIAQQLLPTNDGGRAAAFEVLTATPAVRNLIRNGKLQQLKSAILAGKNENMQTIEKSIEDLCRKGKISHTIATHYLEE